MRGTNACAWLLLGKTELCGRSCVGEYCKAHNARLAKGCGTCPCQTCGVGVKTSLALCRGCGAARVRLQIWREKQRAFRAEFKRLGAIETSN